MISTPNDNPYSRISIASGGSDLKENLKLQDTHIGIVVGVQRDGQPGAITINKVGDKKFEAEIDLGKCVYCGQCVDSCPKKALGITPEFELAQIDRNKLKITYNEPGPQAEPEKKAE